MRQQQLGKGNLSVKKLSDLENVWLGLARAKGEVRRLEIVGSRKLFQVFAGSGCIILTPLPYLRHPTSGQATD